MSRGEVIRTFEGHKTWGIRCAFDAAGERLLSNDWDKILRVWEPSSGRQLLSLPAEDYAHLQVSPDGRLMANSIADTTTLQLFACTGTRSFSLLRMSRPRMRMSCSIRPDRSWRWGTRALCS